MKRTVLVLLKKIIVVALVISLEMYYVPFNCLVSAKVNTEDYVIMGEGKLTDIANVKKISGGDCIYEGELDKADVKKLNNEGAVVEENILFSASKSNREEQHADIDDEIWNYTMINIDEKMAETSGKDIRIAVLDSGVDFGNVETDGYYDVSGEEDIPWYFQDMTGHGTGVAGIIHNIVPNAKIYSVKVMDASNTTDLSKVIKGIYWCINNNINVINMSFGTLQYSNILEKAINDAYDAGITIVAAAGNKGEKGVEYPAAFEHVISVGAVDSNAEKTQESAEGEGIDIMAPGQQVVSDGLFGTKIVCSGTSIAAPHVTGAAALIIRKNPKVSPDFVKTLLEQSVKKIGDETRTGKGLLDIGYALENYNSFSKKYKKGLSKNDKKMIKSNTCDIEKAETNLLEGSWSDHGALFDEGISGKYDGTASDLQKIKLGSVMPDRIGGITGSVFPTLHGRNNYIANTIAITRLAVKGDSCTVNSISTDSTEVSNAKGIINSLKQLSNSQWKEGGISGTPNATDKKLYFYGMAIHVATDAIAHHSFIWRDNAWRHIEHNGAYGGADDPNTVRPRYEYAKHVAYRIVRAYKAGHQASYSTFSPDDAALRTSMLSSVTFKMENILRNAKRVSSSVSSDGNAHTFFNSYNINYEHTYSGSIK